MTRFDQLGLREPLLRSLDDEGMDRPTALQQAMIPVLRRGGSMVARASTGAGKTLAYGLALLDRLAEESAGEAEAEDEHRETSLRMLVLAPTGGQSEHIGLALVPYAQSVGLRVAVLGGNWGTGATEADLLVATPEQALAEVQASELKLESVVVLVVDDVAGIEALGGLPTPETVLDNLPRETQRVVVSSAFSGATADMVDRRVKRALRYPPEPAVPAEAEQPPQQGRVGYVLIPDAERLDVLARIIAEAEEARPVVFFRSDERAAEIAEALALRGFVAGEPGDAEVDIGIAESGATRDELMEQVDGALGPTISFDVPPDEQMLMNRHAADPEAIVLIGPLELPHLREIAKRGQFGLRPLPIPAETGAAAIRAFRDELRRMIREGDLGGQMLLLAPLFEEFSAAEVAAAASALLRQRQPAQPPAEFARNAPGRAASAEAQPHRSASSPVDIGRAPATWARLYVGVGERDGVRAGDLVGAIAGETNIPGSRVGRIDIRDTFSIVEVQAEVAESVIRSVNGISLKGRSVRVDYDRGGERGRKATGATGGVRRPVRRPPPPR
ncbi:DEAD/DEAH box helicase [soil metagenome]